MAIFSINNNDINHAISTIATLYPHWFEADQTNKGPFIQAICCKFPNWEHIQKIGLNSYEVFGNRDWTYICWDRKRIFFAKNIEVLVLLKLAL